MFFQNVAHTYFKTHIMRLIANLNSLIIFSIYLNHLFYIIKF